jgi:pyochelin biosynthetic protein PchC
VPPSGAGLSYFRRWPGTLGAARVAAVSLPGRDDRFREPLAYTVPAAVQGLRDAVRHVHPLPYVLYGHSLGAVLAFELARTLLSDVDSRAVRGVVVSGRPAPQHPGPLPDGPPARDEDLVEVVEQLTGYPIGAEPELSAVLLPVFRADLTVSAGYRWDGVDPLPVPVVAVGFASDEVARPEAMPEWRAATTGPFRFELLDGDHASPAEAPPGLLAVIRSVLPDG